MVTGEFESVESETSELERSFEQWLEYIEGKNALAVNNFLEDGDNRDRLLTAPGSRGAHHAWEGGYQEHVRQTMMIVKHQLDLMQTTGLIQQLSDEEQFTFSDALTVMFLHDIEKPFIYQMNTDGSVTKRQTMTKNQRKDFRQQVIDSYGFEITPTMTNALQYVEGVHDEDYIPGERVDQPLAALCHAADNISARAFYDYS